MASPQIISTIPTLSSHTFPSNPNPSNPPHHHFLCPTTVRFTHAPKRHRFRVVVMASKADHYTTLNVSRDATLDQVKRSYRKLARKYHPDMNKAPGSEDKFKEISAAYEVLSNEEKRALYDRFGEAGLQGIYDGPNFDTQAVDPFQVFESIFGEADGIFGGQGMGSSFGRNRSRQSLDIWFKLSLTFEESVFGVKRDIDIPCLETCGVCSGTGAKSPNSIKSCTECGGRGRVIRSQRTPFGVVSQVSSCMRCGGDGNMVTDHCSKCQGRGTIRSNRTIEVVIPPGVENGATMHIRGEGNVDKNRANAGDLYLVLNVEEKYGIWREGLDLFSRVSIDYTDAILGAVVKVDTVEGSKELQIPSGIQPGGKVKLSHMGVPKASKSSVRGDHVFIVDVQIPIHISHRERKLVEELASHRSSSYKHTTSVNDDMEKSEMSKERTNSLRRENKTGSFTWNAVKDFFGRKQSGKGFASFTMEMPPTLWRCSRLDSPLSSSLFAVFLVACIFALVTKTNCVTYSSTNSASQLPVRDRVTKKE